MPSMPCETYEDQQPGDVAAAKAPACSNSASAAGFQLMRPPADGPASPLDEPYLKGLLTKWDVYRHACLLSFHYPCKHYHKMQGAELALDLLNDAACQAAFQVAVKTGGWASLGGAVTHVDIEPVPATAVRMDLFDRLSSAEAPIVRGNGSIVKRMDDVREGYQVSDMLREMLLCEESDNADLYTEDERSELLFRVFEHLVLGGACCQFEDSLEPYLEAAKRLYKQLVSVQKNSAGKVEVASSAYVIKSVKTEKGVTLFPSQSRSNLCVMTVDPLRRTAKLWYSAFVPYW